MIITQIQLIGDYQGVLDTSNVVPFPVTFSIGEIRDITRRTGAFSKTVTLPGTKNNNLVLGSYFDINISAGTYNVNKIQQCVIIQGGQIVMDSAFIQLISVRKKQNIINEDDIVEYDVIIKDTASMFFSRVGSKLLTDLPKTPFDLYNYEFTSGDIVDSFSNQWSISGTSSYKPYKFFLPYLDKLNYPYADVTKIASAYRPVELAPAIYAKFYWDLIHSAAGFSYTWDTLSDPLVGFDKFLITDNKENRRAPQEIIEFNSVTAENTSPMVFTMSNTDTVYETTALGQIALFTPTIVSDPSTSFESWLYPLVPGTSSSAYWSERTTGAGGIQFTLNDPNYNPTAPFGISTYKSNSYYQTGTIKFNLEIDWDFLVNNYQGFDIESPQRPSGGPIPSPAARPRFDLRFRLFNITTGTYYNNSRVIRSIYPNDKYYPAYSLTEITGGLDIVTIELDTDEYISIDDELTFQLYVAPNPSIYTYDLRFTEKFTYDQVGVNPIVRVNRANLNIQVVEVPYGAEVPLAAYIPGKIKQSDFLKSISTMFNLFCVPDINNPTNLIWKRRDNFYDEGPIVDWTYKLDRGQWQEVQFLPELTSKTITLTYKQDDDEPNRVYFNSIKEIYGQQKIIFSSEWIKTDEVKDLIWSPTPFARSIWGGSSPMYDNVTGDYNLRVFYDGGLLDTIDTVYIVDIYNADIPLFIQTPTNQYPLTTHMSGEYGSGYDINFGICDFYFMDIITTENNLYNLNWRRTMNQLDNQKMLIAYFNITKLDISTLDMSSKIRIDNSYWVINRIIDYDFTSEGLTKVELVSIEEAMNIVPL
jgi:hypothetical protein